MTDNIKLPELPAGFTKHNLSGHDEAVFTDLQMIEYARAAVLADRERDGVTLEGCLETLFKIGEHLGLDYSASRSAEGKPSDVYIKAIEAKVSAAVLADRERMKGKVDALRRDAERYRWLRNNANSDEDGLCAVRIDYWSDEYVGTAGVEVIDGHHLDSDVDAARAAGGEA